MPEWTRRGPCAAQEKNRRKGKEKPPEIGVVEGGVAVECRGAGWHGMVGRVLAIESS